MIRMLLVSFVMLTWVGTTNAGLIFFDNRADFELASGLTGINEDFEEANVAPFGVSSTTDPLNQFTNDGIFSTGDIVPGLSLASSSGTGVVALGAGAVAPTKAVAANFFADSNILSFMPGYNAIGLELFSNVASDILDIGVLGVGDVAFGATSASLSGTTSTPTFFGVISDMGLISQLTINSQSGGGEVIDNVTFGRASVNSVPEPSIALLFSLGIAGLVLRKTKKNRS